MQQPPPQMGPPPPGGPQYSGPPSAVSGMDKKTAGLLCYLAGWVTGIIFLFVGKNDPDIKFHAAQAIVFFGGFTILRFVLGLFTGISGIGGVFGILNLLVSLIIVAGWIYSLYTVYTNNGARFSYPFIGQFITPYAEQLAARV